MIAVKFLRRLAVAVLTLFLLMGYIFIATEILPGDALDLTMTADEIAAMPPEALAQKKHELGLDRPAIERFAGFVVHVAQLDFGKTLITRAPVADIVWMPFRNSLLLAAATLCVAIPLALLIGCTAAVFHNRWPDHLISATVILGYSVPEFVIGTVLVLLFAVTWPLFPATVTANTNDPAVTLLAAAPLPMATVIIGSVAYLARILRAGMIEALSTDFVERLRLTGIPEYRVVLRHALPAAVGPALTASALYAAALVSGIVVVELVFAYPGIGQQMVRAVSTREIPIIQAIAILSALAVIGTNLLADLVLYFLDPRRR